MNFGDFQAGKAQQPIPPVLAPHESEISDFAILCNKTCNRILNLLALGLEVCSFRHRHRLPTRPSLHMGLSLGLG